MNKNTALIIVTVILIAAIVLIRRYRHLMFGKQYNGCYPTYNKGDSFPLQCGSSGDNVLSLQKSINKMRGALGITLEENGKFDNPTQQAVIKVINKPTVSLLDFNKYFLLVVVSRPNNTSSN